jgi:acyl carrier protein
MTDNEIRDQIIAALTTVAPEVDVAALDSSVPLRNQVDLDSMDFLRFVVELHRRVGVDVPETDYPRLTSLDAIADYFAARR